jgi:hypothetical protein
MSDEMTLGTTTPLPAPPAGWFDYGYAALWNGNLALIRTDRDVRTEHARWRGRVRSGDLYAQPPNLHDVRLRLSKFDGGAEFGAIEVPAEVWPKADCLADGRWLIASTNARLFAADGTPAGTFAIGDGINHIRCAPDGTIWVGYFDEGVLSGCPVSASGVARFGPDGSVLWRFEHADLSIVDCYALTLDGNTVWCCPYTNFPIVRVQDGVVQYWQNEVAGADALAVGDGHVLLAGGYKDESERIALVRLGADRAQLIGEWRFPRPERGTANLVQGQGETLHVVGEGRWSRLSLATIRASMKT